MNLSTLTEITTAKLADNAVTVAKLAPDLDTLLAGKQSTISGGATTILTSNLTPNRALVSDASGKVAVGAATVGLIPCGAVTVSASNTVPSGWLAANGAAVSRSAYSALFGVISTLYGAGDGTSTFNLPDLRGYFVRGAGTNVDGSASGTFGAKQQDEIQSHTHTYSTPAAAVAQLNNGSGTFGVRSSTATNTVATGQVPTGATETRPKNIAMLYCIKT